VQKDHNLSNNLLGSPGFDNPLFAFGTNAIEFRQPFGPLLDHVTLRCH
jgi:hypothetical protein